MTDAAGANTTEHVRDTLPEAPFTVHNSIALEVIGCIDSYSISIGNTGKAATSTV